MHHLIYSSQDTFIDNQNEYSTKNFGLDEVLEIGTENKAIRQFSNTKDYFYSNVYVISLGVDDFTGTILSSSISGTASYASGSIINSGSSCLSFTTPYFSGNLVGSISGSETGSFIYSSDFSGSLTSFSGNISTCAYKIVYITWDSGSVDWDIWSTAWDGDDYDVTIGSINGIVSGSLYAGCQRFFTFDGILQDLNGIIHYGFITGKDTRPFQHWENVSKKNINRSLIKFDISNISKSISDGSIISPDFKLKLKSVKALNLPISYTLYALPISQSWVMGNGYSSDEGSDIGASWFYRDMNGGNFWYPHSSSNTYVVDFINYPERSTESFSRGGGTWYTDIVCSQSFDYQLADVSMDVNSIVYSWLSGSISNEGFIIITSDELSETGSGMDLQFFSKDTNTIYQPVLDVGWNDVLWNTGSLFTSSVNISTIPAVLSGSIISGSYVINDGNSYSIYGIFNSGIVDIHYDVNTSASGFLSSNGCSGSIKGLPIFGDFSGSISSSYLGNVTSSYLLATFIDGAFSSSIFTASINGFELINGNISGYWNPDHLIGSQLTSYSSFYPFSYATFNISGMYFNGSILGNYTIINPFSTTIFNGTMTSGNQAGVHLYLIFSGSFLTSSYSYTSSVDITSSILYPIEFNKPFSVIVQDLKPTLKSNNIVRINIFGREKFPLKNFNRQTQFTQFLIPKYLPTSSYYSIKDNETEQIIIDFDNNTSLSCDINGNYFLLDTSGLGQERYYRVLIKTEKDGNSYTFDNGDIFKITR
jgi:hypothetical protein